MNNRTFKGFTITKLYDSALVVHLAAELNNIDIDELLPLFYYCRRYENYCGDVRGIAAYVIHYELMVSLMGIGYLFKRDHSTVSHWLERVNRLTHLARRAERLRLSYHACQSRPDLWPIVYRMLYPQQLEFC